MSTVATIAVLLVAALHVYFLLLEMVFWTKPLGRRVFALDAAFAEATRGLAANQGLYNGFLAAGLVWGVIAGSTGTPDGRAIETFFLVCVIVAGAFGAATVNKKILFVQAMPAAIALVLVWLAPHG